MDTSESPTSETADRRPTNQRLQGLRRGLTLLDRTRSRDDRRVMLGYLFKDLEVLREEAAASPHLYERFAAIEAKALSWRAKLGAPFAPDEDPATQPALRRRKKEDQHGPAPRRTRHPDAHDGTPAAPVVSQG